MPGENVRLVNTIRWIIAAPAALIGAALLRWLILRIDITLAMALDLPMESPWVRLILTFSSLGPCAFVAVMIPVALVPSRKREAAVGVAGVAVLVGIGIAVVAAVNSDTWPVVEAATIIAVSSAAAAAAWKQHR